MVVRSSSGSGQVTVGAEKVELSTFTVSRIELDLHVSSQTLVLQDSRRCKRRMRTYPADMVSRVALPITTSVPLRALAAVLLAVEQEL